ncbi:hypothetical protein [Pelotomaculum propionicicum]|uniref:Uncharacterized protein n=1 Tax=Pelotomaculum propionicicum TaxID=258475 RepID=A0A4Y7RL25_9FIRM|nr:hypothetical protein [Pelotomaculum propionicicum]TEB09392.1 hypothetical protein Pmgp_03163 [Pelotomaculum propionicicum]
MNEEIAQPILTDVEEIKGETLPEIQSKKQNLLARRDRLEQIEQERNSLEDLRQLAEFETKQAGLLIKGCKNILKDNLAAGAAADWASLYNDKPFPPFVAKNPAPRYKQVVLETGVPPRNFLSELLFPSVKNRRLQKETDAKTAYDLKMKQYEEEKAARLAAYEEERKAYLAAQSAYNSEVEKLQFDFEKGRPAAIESFARIALDQMIMPDLITAAFDVSCRPEEKLLLVNSLLPGYYELPRAVSYRYDEAGGTIAATEMEEQEYDLFYRSLVLQIALSALQIIFKVMPARHIQWVAFNGWVNNDGAGDSQTSKSCILTCQAARDIFKAMDLARNTPQDSFFGLKGVLAESLQEEGSVQPIVSSENIESRQAAGNAKNVRPPEYRPGEFKQVTTKIVVEMLDQVEKKLLEYAMNRDDVIH